MHTLLQDLRYSLRTLLKTPAFTIAAVITLALGIGANTAIFSTAEGIWLNPLPFTDSGTLVLIGQKTPESGYWSVPAATFATWKARARSFSGLAAYREDSVTLTGTAVPARLTAARVSPDFFGVLTSEPMLGRRWTPQENQPGHAVALISYGLWQSQFGGGANVIGRTLRINDEVVTITGVMRRDFNFPAGDDLWMPQGFTPNDWADTQGHRVHTIGRLRDGVSLAQAAAEMKAISNQLAEEQSALYRNHIAELTPLRDQINGNITPIFLRTLLGAALLVLLIACVNVSSLQFARATGRRHEFAVRAALGGARWRLIRQLLTESVLLAFVGALVATFLAYWTVRLLVNTMPADIARQIAGWNNIHLDPTTLLVTAVVACIAGVISGVAPALRASRVVAGDALKGRTSSEGRTPQRLRAMLVIAETAIALTLVVGTALIVRGFQNILSAVQKFNPGQLVIANLDFSAPRYSDPAQRIKLLDEAIAKLNSEPGTAGAFVFTSAPFSNNGVEWRTIQIPGREDTERTHPGAIVQSVSPGFFSLMHVPLLSGRDVSSGDAPGSLPVAIVSQKLAQRYWPTENPIGRSVVMLNGKSSMNLTIIGVAADVVYDWTDNAPEPVLYLPFQQSLSSQSDIKGKALPTQVFVGVRSSLPPNTVATTMRAAFAELDADLPVDIRSLQSLLWSSMSGVAEVGGMMAAFGLVALALATAGVYGIVAYSVSQRTREIAVRMAVGAQRSDVLRVVIRAAMLLVITGVIFGFAGALVFGKLVTGFFYGVSPADFAALASSVGVLCAVGLLASYIPARRAAAIEPMQALRYE